LGLLLRPFASLTSTSVNRNDCTDRSGADGRV